MAGSDGVVPCAGLLISPAHADPEYWPLRIPSGYRHCDVLWNERALSCLEKAENSRRRWQSGLALENRRVVALAAAHDPRYRRMTARQLEKTALWRWRLSTAAQALRRSENNSRERAEKYLAFVEFRRNAGAGPA
ncbi:hypothetical protein AB0F81_29450 [Actinoplanes sp. NPDC024001]|uniref:hypothetical protein n=1 Tax=Actinoplanes sp. NPDC024001 TaxID=3154598 RepID=UPI0033C5EDD7